MRETPILFSAPMVPPVLSGSKTQTRRAMRDQVVAPGIVQIASPGYCEIVNEHGARIPGFHCPYGKPGDRLWVRETFFAWGRWETRFSAKKGRDEWHFVDMTLESGKSYLYAANGQQPQPMGGMRHMGGATPTWWKRPAIFMPRAASRITLEVTDVRVERLQDISAADAQAEGAPPSHASIDAISREFGFADFPRSWYAQLWDEINGAGSWDANPWAWAVTFKRVQS